MIQSTLAFIFDKTLTHVLLVHKLTPDWQKGYINGVGGKVEEGETSIECVIREVEEETTLKIPESKWIYLGHHFDPKWNIDNYACIYEGQLSDARRGDKEQVEWFLIQNLPKNVISNLHWIIPFAIDKLHEPRLKEFSVGYS